jgi:uncharacterized protein (UPF0210 family)
VAITEVLKSVDVQTYGYSGLMLPVLEDPVPARRAGEGRYGVAELLLYSSVCGTGLDVIPLPGDTSVTSLAATMVDIPIPEKMQAIWLRSTTRISSIRS